MKTDLIIFAGQSNMQGMTESLPACNDPVPNAQEYRYLTDSLTPLRHPVGENIDYNGQLLELDYTSIPFALEKGALLGTWAEKANMVPAFCNSYSLVTGNKVVAVHVAKGATVIEYWQPGNAGYEMLVKKVKAAIEKVRPDRVLLAWLQGESDALASTTKDVYTTKLKRFNDALKAELGLEKFGIILVGRFAADARDDAIIEAQKELCDTDPDFLMLTTVTEQLTKTEKYMNPQAYGHYGCEGQQLLGTLAGAALGEYAKKAPQR